MRTPMGRSAQTLAACGALLVVLSYAPQASATSEKATYCDSVHPQVHVSGNLVWCADPTFWAAHSAQVTPFYSWGDQIIPALEKDFGLNSSQVFYIVIDAPNGGASTPTPYGPGINITGDAFYGTAYNIYGFWAYLLITHEFVNQWTGLVTGGGWPNDWWADHRSPFPNSMDAYVLAQLGQTAAAAAQKARFLPGGDSADAEVVLFNNLMDNHGGFAFLQKFVALLQGDGMQWGNLRDPPNYTAQTAFISGNPSAMLAEHVVAYLSLAAGSNVTAAVTASGVGIQPPNWPSDQTFTPYSVDSTQVQDIADAHCAIAAAKAQGASTTTALANLHKGNYAAALNSAQQGSSACGTGCPSECGCDSTNHCIAAFHATTTSPTTPTPTPTPTPSGGAPITLVENTGYCIDLPGGNTTNGTQLQTWTCNGTSSQALTYSKGQLVLDNKCLQAASSASSPLQLSDCTSSAQQQWVVSGKTIALANTSLCIDVPNNAPSAGRSLWVYTCNGSAAQNWNVASVATHTQRPSGNTGLCMDVRSSGTTDGTPVQIWSCNGTAAQSWALGGGRASSLGHCLGLLSAAQGTAVGLYNCTETNGITWTSVNGALQLGGTSMCLDLPNNSFTSGTALRIWPCNGSAAQTWVAQ